MIVQCPNCKSQYDVQTNGSSDGISIRCGVCGTVINTNQHITITPLDNSNGGYLPQRRNRSSKGLWFLLIAVIIVGVMILTKPEKEKHVEKISELLMEIMQEKASSEDNEMAKGLMMMMGSNKVNSFVDTNTYINDYIFFNVGHLKADGEDKTATIGIFNTVILLVEPKDNL